MCKKMKAISVIIFICVIFNASAKETLNQSQLCLDFIRIDENYKKAHENAHCLKSAEEGNPVGLYQVGMGYGFSGNRVQEEKYYRLAAEKGAVSAFLNLGHMLRTSNENESIYWYKKYINASIYLYENGGAGYASLILAKIFKEKNNNSETNYWLNMCKKTTYAKNCKL